MIDLFFLFFLVIFLCFLFLFFPPNATATVGKLPAYEVMDLSLTYKANELYTIKTGVNNLTDAMYATRRASGYPGPGILPANGRTMYLTISIKL